MTKQNKSWWQRLFGWFAGWFTKNKDTIQDIATEIAKAAVKAAIDAFGRYITSRNKGDARTLAIKYAKDNYPEAFAKNETKIKNEINRQLGQEVAKNEAILKRRNTA